MTVVRPTSPLLVRLPGRALTLDDVSELAAADELHRYEQPAGHATGRRGARRADHAGRGLARRQRA
ncbi:hypothetical protein [Frankia sp. Cppng1_Ct_nod]|uniref:hypothetical protein n=1 Tax=Frankia sp. Cppng1_Ct_nod TaxID=2897162 RepID=UPI0010410FDB|nr:hypothetical protein [Frankia sp. Cppng1_Ct_nod]